MRRGAALAWGFLLCAAPAIGARAADPAYGKILHDSGCLECHDQKMYTRSSHIVTNYAELRKRVEDCAMGAGMTWFEEEMDDVAAYLNQNFYHFPGPSAQ